MYDKFVLVQHAHAVVGQANDSEACAFLQQIQGLCVYLCSLSSVRNVNLHAVFAIGNVTPHQFCNPKPKTIMVYHMHC